MIKLEIEGEYVEMSDELEYSLNKAYEDLSNPTTIINEWSKTIEVPFTQHNNKIFGQFYSPNRIIVANPSNERLVGLYFNPTKKLNFRLLYNETPVIEGYLKTISVKQKDGRGTYIYVTLNGMLGKIFQEMKSITFDSTALDDEETEKYYLDGSVYVDDYITKELVYDSFNTTGQSTMSLEDSTIHDIIGFAPNNAMSDEFDYTSFQYQKNAIRKFSEVLEETPAFTSNGISAESLIPNGMLPREIGEYRSYNQLPYIYFNKLFQIFQKKSEELTNYEFELDNTWFNNSNPYWHDLVMMLKRFEVKDGNSYNNIYHINSHLQTYAPQSDWRTFYDYKLDFLENGSTEIKPIADFINDRIYLDNVYTVSTNGYITLRILSHYYTPTSNIRMNTDNAFVVRIDYYDENGVTKNSKYIAIKDENSTIDFSNYDNVILLGESKRDASNNYYYWDISVPFMHELNNGTYGDFVTMHVSFYWYKNAYPFDNESTYNYVQTTFNDFNFSGIVSDGIKRSYSHFTLNDLWDNEYNLFDTILNYCKVFGILIQTDDARKKLKFIKRENFFSDYRILNWDNKLDMLNDYTISPIVFEDKYLVFNYGDYDTKNNKRYSERYGVNYGEKRIKTNYNFNNEEKDLFENPIAPSVTCTDNVLSWSNIFGGNIQFSFGAEIMIDNKDEDRKEVPCFGAWYFRNGCANFDTTPSLNLRAVVITDDTDFQIQNGTYTYTQINAPNYAKYTTKYPLLDVVKNDKLVMLNKPMTNYTYLNNYSSAVDIYTQRWEKYLKEQYDLQRKKLTAYFNLTVADYTNFKFNNFVQLGNQLYLVLKIYDFKPNTTQSTKVDLLNIGNVSNYTTE